MVLTSIVPDGLKDFCFVECFLVKARFPIIGLAVVELFRCLLWTASRSTEGSAFDGMVVLIDGYGDFGMSSSSYGRYGILVVSDLIDVMVKGFLDAESASSFSEGDAEW